MIEDVAFCLVFFVLGAFTGVMILSDIIEWVEHGRSVSR